MREQLIGYLLGALDAPEQEEVEKQLEADPCLREELDRLDTGMEPLRAGKFEYSAPEGLAEQTGYYVQTQVATGVHASVPRGDSAAAPAYSSVDGRWTLADLVVAAGVIGAAAMLFFPAIASSRYHAQRAGCENNLRNLSFALGQYSAINSGFFPFVEPRGEMAFAGVYAPVLVDGGYVSEAQYFLCPASASPEKSNNFRIPTMTQLRVPSSSQLFLIRRTSGGDYGYGFGHLDGNRYRGTQNQKRSFFALMSDAPSDALPGRQSSNHANCGQNILFEDGSVRFCVGCVPTQCDNIFLSDRGFVEYGMHADDAVIGFGCATPVLEYSPANVVDP